ncbi:MAG: TVP38/TMEM64 family protein [Microbacteriaceae bacterium]
MTKQLARRAALAKAGILLVLLLTAVAVGIFVPLPSVETIQAAAAGTGWWGAAVFVVAYGLVTLTPIPKNVVSVAAGLTWGLGLGVALVYTGALIGAALAFAIGRALGREAVERFTGARVARVDDLLRRRGLVTLIGVRLVPVLPFTVINYSAGLTAVRPRDYAIGTMVGIVPGTIAYVAVGAFGTTLGWPFYVAAGALGLLTLAGVVYSVIARRTRQSAQDGSAE